MAFGRLHFFTDEPDIPIPQGLAPLHVPPGVLRPPAVFRQSLIGKGGMCWTTGSILFRRESLAEVGDFEAAFPGLGEDAVVWLKISLAYPVYAMDECLLHYRRHSRASGVLDWRRGTLTSGWLKVMDWLYEYVQKQPEEIRRRAWPIVRTALFRSLKEETHNIITASPEAFTNRLRSATRLWFSALRRYPEISAWHRLVKFFNLAAGEACSSLRVRTRLRKFWRSLRAH
jgi:hypothetical protein